METGKLTPRQQQILKFIKDQVRGRGYPPSVREIGSAVGLTSSSTVHSHLARLEQKGLIRRDPTKPRTIEILDEEIIPFAGDIVNVPVIGQVTAGSPVLAEENILEYLPLPRTLARDGRAYILSVRGESMVEAGILDGDMVIVRPQETAENGEIVVVLLGDEATVKRFYRERDRIRLQPANSRMQPIYSREVRILGKVIGIYRDLQ
ncbi:MAG: transcriptional repressor LexA [Firmicutes bacterium]|nr:transcriptional repressor LexA [Bacillota bacterium]